MKSSFPSTLEQWLDHVSALHARPIELGLDRLTRVRDRMKVSPAPIVITVGGTNGKGSTCAMLESICASAGMQVGLYSSPHLFRYNERVRVGCHEADDETLVAGFGAVESARAGESLTYFEFGTLAAAQVFADAQVDIAILEVGLGGRLDAVNVFDSDCAVVVSVGIDHTDFLGPTREHIGWEKAGIFRSGKPAVVGDPDPPDRLLAHADQIGAQVRRMGIDFGFVATTNQWQYWQRAENEISRRSGMAYPALRGTNQLHNASIALAAIDSLQTRVAVSMQDIRLGLAGVELAGRFQVVPGRPSIVLDVAHNAHAAGVLATNLASQGFFQRTWAVCGMLADKDARGTIAALAPHVDHWMLADLGGPRALSASALQSCLPPDLGGPHEIEQFSSPGRAFASARERASENDRILVFGSFLTVSDVMRELRQSR